MALVALAVGRRNRGYEGSPGELEGVMAGLVPAIHVVRRIECS
jgi:hypothetical protein